MSAINGRTSVIGSKLQELIDDARNSITQENVRAISRSTYEKSIGHLTTYAFWSGSGRRIHPLWSHQIAAISLRLV